MSTQAPPIIHDHTGLLSQLEVINQWWPDSHQKVIAGIHSREIQARLKALRESLMEHFAAEECEGLLPQDVRLEPNDVGVAVQLLGEHQSLLEQLNLVMQVTPRSAGTLADWALAHQAFDRFSERLTQHEQAEIDLLQRVCDEETGVPD